MIRSTTIRAFGLLALVICGMSMAYAHGPRGYIGYRHGWGYDPWIAPVVIGSAIVGTSIYMSRPYGVVQPNTVYINTLPPSVVMHNPSQAVQWGAPNVAPPATEAYYCRETGQYFPLAQTCVSPWLVVYQN